MSYSSSELTAIGIQVVIVLVIARRSFAMTRGVSFSAFRLAVIPVLLLILWGLTELESTLLTPWALPYLVGLDSVILIGTALVSAPIAQRMTVVTREPSGSGSYRIGFSMAVLFVGAFVVRLALAAALFPSSFEFGSPPGGFPPIQQQTVLGLIDAIFSVSVGLLVGRSVGIYRRWQAAGG